MAPVNSDVQRRSANRRLGWALALCAVALFAVTLLARL